MPTRKVADAPEYSVCRDPDHDPPSVVVFDPGVYVHECSGCGRKSMFRINKPTLTLASTTPWSEQETE